LLRKTKKKREAIDTKNQGDSLVYQTRKQLAELGEKLPNDLKEKVENKVRELEEALNTDDTNRMRTLIDDLQKEVTNIGQVLYSQQDTKTNEQRAKDVTEKKEKENKNDVIDADVANR
jgi:molecular chaperone DnaK (HSP70)